MTGTTSRVGPRPVHPAGILAERLADLSERLARVDDLDPRLLDEAHELARLAGGLDDYTVRCTTPESTALRGLARRTAEHDWAARDPDATFLEQEMLSGHVEGQLLKLLVHATGARRVLEIGMFTGYSALAMAEAVLESGVEDGVVVACELDADVARLAAACFADSPAGGLVDVRVGPALDTLSDLADAGEPFDLVFVDADKAGYAGYLEVLLECGLLGPRALVCVDNTLMQGEPWLGASTPNGEAIAAFNAALAADERVEQVLMPVRDGLTLIRRVGP